MRAAATFLIVMLACAGVARAQTEPDAAILAALSGDSWHHVLGIRVESDPHRLARDLRDRNGTVRIFAARRFSVLGPRANEASAELLRALETDEENLVREACATAIGRFVTDTTAAVAALERVSRTHESLLVRRAAGDALAEFGTAGIRAVYAHAPSAPACDAWIYRALLRRWVNERDLEPGTGASLVRMVEQPADDCALRLGLRMLGNVQPPHREAIPAAVRALASAPAETGDEAIRMLRLFGVVPGGRVQEGLPAEMDETEASHYREWARFAIEHPTGDWFREAMQPRIDSTIAMIGSQARAQQLDGLNRARELGALCADAAPRIAPLVVSPDAAARDLAWSALLRVDPIAAGAAYRDVLGATRDAAVVVDAIERTDRMLPADEVTPPACRPDDALRMLRPLTASPDVDVRRAAIVAIARDHRLNRGAVDIMVAGLGDAAVAADCVGALGSMGPDARAALPGMERALETALAQEHPGKPYAHPAVRIATSIAAVDSSAGRAAAVRLATLDDELAREVSARILDPARPARMARRAPLPEREIDALLAGLSGNDNAARERARATLVDAGVAATAATPRIEALARAATGPDRARYYEVLEAIDPRTKYPFRY